MRQLAFWFRNTQSVRDVIRVSCASTGFIHESWSLHWTGYVQPVPRSWLQVPNSPGLLILPVCVFGDLITRPGQYFTLPIPEIQREEWSCSLCVSISGQSHHQVIWSSSPCEKTGALESRKYSCVILINDQHFVQTITRLHANKSLKAMIFIAEWPDDTMIRATSQ